jgi:ubiquinone/menaquinone biosynthesis C-methylase UbiE
MRYSKKEFIKHTENIPLYRWQTTIFPVLEKVLKIDGYKNEHILDFGCGSGKLNNILRKIYSLNTYGVDISKTMIESCLENDSEGIYKLVEDNGNIPFEDNSFICCYSLWVFVEFESYNSIKYWIKEIYRTLKNNGKIILVINNFANLGKKETNISHIFTMGEENKTYKIGEPFDLILKSSSSKGETGISFVDYYWPPEVYKEIFAECGFINFKYETHANNDFYGKELKNITENGIEIFDKREAEGLSIIISADKSETAN